jgi:hypothetical protein
MYQTHVDGNLSQHAVEIGGDGSWADAIVSVVDAGSKVWNTVKKPVPKTPEKVTPPKAPVRASAPAPVARPAKIVQPKKNKFPVWGYAAIGGGVLVFTTLIVLIARR